MIHYTDTQLITDDELEFINKLSYKLTRIESDDRKYSSYKLNSDEKKYFLNKILKWIELKLNIKFVRYDVSLYDCFLIQYNTGDYFTKHNDNTYMLEKNTNRILVSGFHLPSYFEGGEYCLYNESNKIEIDKTHGIVYVFESKFDHEVKKIKNGTRKSIVIFFDKETLTTSVKNKIL